MCRKKDTSIQRYIVGNLGHKNRKHAVTLWVLRSNIVWWICCDIMGSDIIGNKEYTQCRTVGSEVKEKIVGNEDQVD